MGLLDQILGGLRTGGMQGQPTTSPGFGGVLAPEQLSSIASQAGISEDEVRHGLSQLVPEVVDHLTPQGQLPAEDELLASIDRFASRLGR